jgi:hypothetical protein
MIIAYKWGTSWGGSPLLCKKVLSLAKNVVKILKNTEEYLK